jgi:hypothetical protein
LGIARCAYALELLWCALFAQAAASDSLAQIFPALTNLVCDPREVRALKMGHGLQQLTTLHLHAAKDLHLVPDSFPHLQHLVIEGRTSWVTTLAHACQWKALKTLHLKLEGACFGLLSLLNPMSSRCLQQVSGAVLVLTPKGGPDRDITGLSQQDAQQVQALQARLQQACTLVVGVDLCGPAEEYAEYADYINVCSLVFFAPFILDARNIHKMIHTVPATLRHIIVFYGDVGEVLNESDHICSLLQHAQPCTVLCVSYKLEQPGRQQIVHLMSSQGRVVWEMPDIPDAVAFLAENMTAAWCGVQRLCVAYFECQL